MMRKLAASRKIKSHNR